MHAAGPKHIEITEQNIREAMQQLAAEDIMKYAAATKLVLDSLKKVGEKVYKSHATILAAFIAIQDIKRWVFIEKGGNEDDFDADISKIRVSRDLLETVAVDLLGMKKKTFSAKLAELKKMGFIIEEEDGTLHISEEKKWLVGNYTRLVDVDIKLDKLRKVSHLHEKKEAAVGDFVADIVAMSETDDEGFLLVSVDELTKLLRNYGIGLTLNVVKKIEERAQVGDGKFTRVRLIDYENIDYTDIDELAKKQLYSLVRVKGRVTVVNKDDEQRVVYAKYVYEEDGTVFDEEDVYYDFVYDKTIRESIKKTVAENGQKEKIELEKDYEEVVPVYKLRLISDDGGKYVTVITYQTKAAEIKPGDTIEVVGFIDQVRKKTGNGKVVSQGGLFIRGYDIKKLSDVPIDFSEERIEEFKKFAAEGNVLDRLVDMLDVTEDQRAAAKAIILALVSEKGFRGAKDKQIRTHIHVLMISDAGTGKSTLMRTFSNILNLDKPVNARAASAAGILGTAREDPVFGWYVEAGLLPRNNRRMGVFIDELDKAEESLIAALHSPFEDGWTVIEKAGKARFPSLTSIIAAANPKEELDDFRHVFEQVNLKKTLLDRFDIIIALRKPPLEVKQRVNEEIIDFMLSEEEDKEKKAEERKFVRDYIYYAYYIHKVRGTEKEAAEILKRFVNLYDASRTENTQSKRLATTLSRIAAAVAKINLHDKITVNDAVEAIKIFVESQATLLPADDAKDMQTLIEATDDLEKLAEILGLVERKSEEAKEEWRKNVINLLKMKLHEFMLRGTEKVRISVLVQGIAMLLKEERADVEEVIRNLRPDELDELGVKYLDEDGNETTGDEAVYLSVPGEIRFEELD